MIENKSVVFLGPTLPPAVAATIFDAVYLPPAEQGSVVRAVRTYRPNAIVLIDGAFGKVPAVRHKELLWGLAMGVRIFGAASMGALRAAELGPFGMQGYGFIYRWYALTTLADDDEVAVAMCPPELGSAPLSEALINIRLTLRRALRAGVVTAEERRVMEALARDTHFVDRSYTRLLADARYHLRDEWAATLNRLADWFPLWAIDRKREDAAGLLETLARCPELLETPPKTPPFVMTEAWAHDLEVAGLWGNDIGSIVAEHGKLI